MDNKCQFIPGDAYGIYSSNLLDDVYQVLVSVLVKDGANSDDSILLWDYFKVNKKQVYITLSDKASSCAGISYQGTNLTLRLFSIAEIYR